MRVFASLGLILLLSSCSETSTETKAKEPEKPPAPITAQQAFRYTYPAARAWAGDSLPLRIRSIHLTDVPAEPGKAGAWEIIYVSRAQQQAKIYTCTRNPHLRLVFVAVALLLRNLWVWIHETLLADGRGDSQTIRLDRLRFKRLLDWIAGTVVALLHDGSTPCVEIDD